MSKKPEIELIDLIKPLNTYVSELEDWDKKHKTIPTLKVIESLKNILEAVVFIEKKCNCYLRSNQLHWCDKQVGKICKVTRSVVEKPKL
jgi:hypothetical protein